MASGRFLSVALWAAGSLIVSAASVDSYTQRNLTSDIPGMAANLDANLVNPWGLAASATSPFWVSDNGTGVSTLYTGSGASVPLVVTIPGPSGGSGSPTGIVFNSGVASGNFGGAPFLFGTEAGTIVSWTSGTSGSVAATGAGGSIYKGLGINDAGTLLYAANFGLNRVDVFDKSFKPTSVSGGFTDPSLPAGYAPFNVQSLGGNLFVTYAKTAGGKDEVQGAGLGFVDEFNTSGVFQRRVATQGALNAPWGLALAPKSGFGVFSGDLLVGNFGDGLINAFDSTTGALAGTVDNPTGDPLAIEGLWGLSFGNGARGQNLNTLYFTAGISGGANIEDHGLFGAVDPTAPEPASVGLLLIGASLIAGVGRRKMGARRRS
jgi:uncharacterized protein (TIGR03118 family)